MGQNQSRTSNETQKTPTNPGICPPFIPECELLYEDGPDTKELYAGCTKNPGHPTFIQVNDFTIDHLPTGHKTETLVNDIKKFCDWTVKVTLRYTSLNRPFAYPETYAPYPYSCFMGSSKVRRVGTGIIETIEPFTTKNKPCPCFECKSSNHPADEFLEVRILTAAHVVFDESEAEHVVCELFYDSEDRDKVKCLYGVALQRPETPCLFQDDDDDDDDGDDDDDDDGYYSRNDKEAVKISKSIIDKKFILCVTHDIELIQQLKMMKSLPNLRNIFNFVKTPQAMIISHPHGRSKCVTFGNILSCEIPRPFGLPNCHIYSFQPGEKCRFVGDKSSYANSEDSRFRNILIKTKRDCQFGEEYITKTKMCICIPTDAKYIYRIVLPTYQEDADTNENWYHWRNVWFSFPPGTKFSTFHPGITLMTLSDMVTVSLPLLPSYVQFKMSKTIDLPSPTDFASILTYDVATCPGSSGAAIVTTGFLNSTFPCHAGALQNGTNRSGDILHHECFDESV